MKYGNIIYNKRNKRMNIGDDMQILAIENLFKNMGIDYEDVVRVEYSALYTYDGDEDLIVPISFPLYSYNDKMNITCFSEKIHPVFIGLSVLANTLGDNDIEYLKRFSPIGCRDYHTLDTMKKYNIPAYLFGCITATFPKKWNSNEGKTDIFCVDISEKLISQIPAEIEKDCVLITNVYNTDEINQLPEEKAREQYNMMIDKAKMVVTSRMHVAIPCMAAGIPVIFAKDSYSYRFVGIDRLIKIYSEDEYSLIDWMPRPIEYEEIKEKMIQLAINRIYGKEEEYTTLIAELENRLPNTSMQKCRIEQVYDTERYLESKHSNDDSFPYIIWAVTQSGELIYNMISKRWKNAKLVAAIDKGKKVNFHGVMSLSKEVINEHKNAEILVCADSAIGEAKVYFEKNNIINYFYCCRNGMLLK